MSKIALIGVSSYLAAGFPEFLSERGNDVLCIDWRYWRDYVKELRSSDCIINFAICPEFSHRLMDVNEIIDIQIAREIQGHNTNFIFLSSRKVYGSSAECQIYSESSELKPFDAYSENKIRAEKELLHLLPDNLTILRISNIIGDPSLRMKPGTFMGWIRDSFIKNGYLKVDQDPKSIKDFVTVDFIHDVLAHVSEKKLKGTYNVSSNADIPIYEILSRCVNGKLEIVHPASLSDQFLLQNSKLMFDTGLKIEKEQILKQAEKSYEILEKLRNI